MIELFSPKTEEKILDFWKREQIFEKSLKLRQPSSAKATKGKGKFVFFEGPPSANGRPGIHHVLARVYKDIICRYKTMMGFYVDRKAGWDTHGLPVEIQVEKELGLKNKKEIEKYGVAEFNKKAQEIVWKYKEEWDKLTERMGFWLDLKNPYITYEPRYIESLWSIIARVWNKKLLYQDFKVVPYCVRCGTALSSHEVAQGYEKVSENSVYIKFKLKPGQKIGANFITDNNTYVISWTTTPWTLPGNVALAVGEKIEYEILELADGPSAQAGNIFIFAKVLKDGINVEEEKIKSSFITGKNLVGLEYKPLFPVLQLKSNASYKIYSANFVNTEEGAGVVHIAPMYGVDDFNLGNKVGLPKIHTVDLEGKFNGDFGAGLKNITVKSAQAEKLLMAYLQNNGSLLRSKKYEHDYPFCWRCHSPLLYYAKSSWFIGMEKLRKKLLENNKKINWVPANVKNGRFGEWLSEVKDWAFSRERYWGTPLPIWQCSKCKNERVIGSLEELDKFSSKKLNKYILLRHGEAENNRLEISSSWPEKQKYQLTTEGAGEIEKLVPLFKKKKIDLIFSSDLLRTKETAGIIAGILDIKVIYDKRLREHDFGIYNGGKNSGIIKFFRNKTDVYSIKPDKGENLSDVKKRMMEFLKFLDAKYEGKNILIVSHNNPIISLISAYRGYKNEETFGLKEVIDFGKKTGSVFEMPSHNWPYDDEGELNLHRPHVDNIKLKCAKCSGVMKRIKDVADVWFDSGAMPFAQAHWPFAQKLKYPADFISEGVDQTRGWFYTLHAVGALMDKGQAFKNVICLGHILDEKGEKMSKSKGNIVDPMEIINKYGIDALRWYFFTINPPGEPKRFIVRDVEERLRRFVLTLSNILIFYKTYGIKIMTKKSDFKNSRSRTSDSNLSLLDRWILSRLNQTIKITRTNLDKYEVVQAARPIDDFVDDLSRWWLRRSRKRFSGGLSAQTVGNASIVLRIALEELSKLIAPFTPFLAEHIWRELGNENSVHLADYPKPQLKLIDKKLEEQMDFAKETAAKGLALRAEAGIKVRQPLAALEIKSQISNLKINDELLNLIKDEVNVKEIVFGVKFRLDTKITAELKEEGLVRELARIIQEMRRGGGLVPADSVKIYLKLEDGLKNAISRSQKTLCALTGAKTIEFTGAAKDGLLIDRHFKIENKDAWVGIIKIG